LARGENWRAADGLEVYYRIYDRPLSRASIPENDLPQYSCTETIAERTVQIRVFYSVEAYVPGQYVVAEWAIAHNRTAVITAIAPDSARIPELLSIVRSVGF
jgi:hypothetical protein